MFRLSVLLFITTIIGCVSNPPPKEVPALTDSENWLFQVDSLLMPYWMMDEAIGIPQGNYNTYRYNDGSIVVPEQHDYSTLDESIRDYIIQGTDSLRREFVRMSSRQIYAYCVGYHMTGNEDYLVRAKQGLDYLINKGAFADGSVVSFYRNEEPYPDSNQRTTQDLAYGLLGPTMYYYLTRDPEILDLILEVKRNIWKKYYEESDLVENTKLMKWVVSDFEADSAHYMNLLAPMDQLNANLLIMATVAPDSLKEEFLLNIKTLAYSIKDNFYNPHSNSFLGNLNNKSILGGSSDLGHSIKTFWMLYTSAKMIGDDSLSSFAYQNGKSLLEKGFINELGRWGSSYADSSLNLNRSIFSWQYAEFDQTAATFSLQDTSIYSKYLKSSYKQWYKYMYDKDNGEIWWGLGENNEPTDVGFKAGMWKNGFHSLEHTLIGHITSNNYYDRPLTLYFAFHESVNPEDKVIQPYYYSAEILVKKTNPMRSVELLGLEQQQVVFNNIN